MITIGYMNGSTVETKDVEADGVNISQAGSTVYNKSGSKPPTQGSQLVVNLDQAMWVLVR